MDYFEQLPEEIKFFAYCNECLDPYESLLKDYAIDDDGVYLLIDVADKLLEKQMSAKDVLEYLSALPLSLADRKIFVVKFLAYRFLVMDNYFDGEISKAIEELGGNIEEFENIINTQEAAWEIEKKELIDNGQLEPDLVLSNDTTDEKGDILNILSDDLSFALSVSSVEAMEEIEHVNYIIGMVLSEGLMNKLDYSQELISALMGNTSVLTVYDDEDSQQIIEMSVSEWLKDYLEFAGDRFADNLMMARYVIESPKVKVLPVEQRVKVKNLLILYKNLFSFNTTINTVSDVDKLQFFPIDLLKMRYGNLDEPVIEKSKNKEMEKASNSKTGQIVVPEKKENKPVAKAASRYQVVLGSIKVKDELIKIKNSLSDKNLDQLLALWREGFSNNQQASVVAVLTELFKRPNFSSPWFTTPEIREVLTTQTVAYPSLTDPAVREGIINPVVIAVVVKAILQRLGFSEEQAAVLFLQIASHDPRLASFVYFDAKKETFAWRQFMDKQ